jgi:parallel beta-helix repeat protein
LPIIKNNIILGNQGPGIYSEGSTSFPTIIGNLITDNASSYDGGGVCAQQANILRNVICDNTAVEDGGGIYVSNSSVIAGNIIAGNRCGENGGGIAFNGGMTLTAAHNTIVGNRATKDGGGLYFGSIGMYSTIRNSIFWNNVASTSGQEICHVEAILSIDHSVVQRGMRGVYVATRAVLTWGPNMIDTDPLFVAEKQGDYHLLANSPCVGFGDPAIPKDAEFYFEGDPRKESGGLDVGADEFHPHLYVTGTTARGQTAHLKIVGPPGAEVVWAVSLMPALQDPPLVIPGVGALYLEHPMQIIHQGAIPSTGVLVLPCTFPTAWPVPQTFPLQALVSNGAKHTLTAPWVVHVAR